MSLGLSHDTIHQIKADKLHAKQCLYATINCWLRRKATGKVTWRTLIRALQSPDVDEADLAETIMAEKGRFTGSILNYDTYNFGSATGLSGVGMLLSLLPWLHEVHYKQSVNTVSKETP